MEILQEQFNTLLKKMGLRTCFRSLRPRFSSTGISKVHLTCSSSRDVDVQHLFEDTYSHIPIHPKSRRSLQVAFIRQIYKFIAHTFGLSLGPWLFILVARKFASLIHAQNQHYSNSGLLTGSNNSRDCCAQHRDLIFLLCEELGWIVILEKSELIPPQVLLQPDFLLCSPHTQ